MRRFLRTLTFAIFCGILAIPTIDAQGRREGRNGNRTENTQNGRRASNNRQASKPANRNNNRNNVNKGNNSKNDKNKFQGHTQQRHDNYNNHNNRRPQHGNGNRHNHNYGYNHGHNDHNRPHYITPPHRPHRPKVHVYHRPPTPASYCYHHRCPVIRTILGINLGTSFNISLNYLYNNGFIIDGYGNDRVYLRNVSQMSLIWPDATLYYGNNGLIGSEFCYSTSYYDTSRYNQLYSTFVTQYGSPMSYSHNGNHITATWWGQNSFVTLSFNLDYSSSGHQRYYTTLSFGL